MTENDNIKVANLIGAIEPYIPIIASDDSIDVFLEAALRNDVAEVKRLEAEFISSSKIQFIHLLLGDKNGDLWRNTVDTCQAIRKYKTDGVLFSL